MPHVLVVGAGHAGIEAALAAHRRGAQVTVVTGARHGIGLTPCNPAVGGVAKGHLVAEIEAMGGFIGRAADRAGIHARVLNRSKGPAVWGTRVQVDKRRYAEHARRTLESAPGLRLVEALVADLEVRGGRIVGVRLEDGTEIPAEAVVVTTGTFLRGRLHVGHESRPGGRTGEAPATRLAEALVRLGFRTQRLKTGTPPRIDRASVAFGGLEVQPGEVPTPGFSLPLTPAPPRLPQLNCHLTWTNSDTHAVIEANLSASAMYGGRIVGRGPRYCPSIEDKVVRFPHRGRHQVFLEPEGLDSDWIYPNGISTSLPPDVQERFVRTIPGLERARIVQPGYAVEYDAVDARQLDHRLAARHVEGLFFAGQVNGTSGYEEAAAQGLVAGAGAAAYVLGAEPLVLSRRDAYIGVLVDDLVTQGCDEPYRMFTARAEYRILLREDNADERLEERAFALGLVDEARVEIGRRRREIVERAYARLRAGVEPDAPAWARMRAEARRVYAGYVDKLERDLARIEGRRGANLEIPADIDYFALPGLSREAAERLDAVRPATTAQAGRIPGLSPGALASLWAHVRKRRMATAGGKSP
ncbi:MAG: tRNA uridine-5-carboxymethylaminomethyl(34) synthesis enzyme MnmG [Deltaproteobacteria bacterium]|nr:MAG: tRNA uridine-5-carboxymethylaminomethyl(34) synthesis enzyme MnmG [Deltaproteobacteria bacterium]